MFFHPCALLVAETNPEPEVAMQAPTNLEGCIDVAIRVRMPTSKVAAAFDLDFAEFEIEGAIAERLARAKHPKNFFDIGIAAPNQASLRRALSRVRAKGAEKKLAPPVLELLEKVLRLIEELHQIEFDEYSTLNEDEKAEIRQMIMEHP